ncbi:hypothetical protein BJX64DRAFT_270549 [Aspergillus heterothallicus]
MAASDRATWALTIYLARWLRPVMLWRGQGPKTKWWLIRTTPVLQVAAAALCSSLLPAEGWVLHRIRPSRRARGSDSPSLKVAIRTWQSVAASFNRGPFRQWRDPSIRVANAQATCARTCFPPLGFDTF